MSDPTATPVLESRAASGPDWTQKGFIKSFIERRIKKVFGREYTLEKLQDLFDRVRLGKPVADEEVVEMALMYAYYLEHTAGSPLEAELLYLYLNQQQPRVFRPTSFPFDSHTRRITLKPEIIRGDPSLDRDICIKGTTTLERAVVNRLKNPDRLHPPKPAELPRPDGTVERITPAPSPLRGGGTETIYKEILVTLPGDEKQPIKQALGTLTVTVKMTVTSTYDPAAKTWTITTDQWENWGYDQGDFEWDTKSDDPNAKKTQDIAIDPADLLPKVMPFRKEALEIINTSFPGMDDFLFYDKYMHQIENKIIRLEDNSVYAPEAYDIYVEPWYYEASDPPCSYAFKVLEYTEPFPEF